jgi:hypothetical protein
MVISCFEKAEEVAKFCLSIEASDIAYIPKVFVINTDPQNGRSGKEVIGVAQKFKNSNDRIFVCHKNLYMSAYRYVIQEYLTNYEYFIGTEADLWFEKFLKFQPSIDYIKQHPEIGLISILSRFYTESCNAHFSRMKFMAVDNYMDMTSGHIRPWHLYLTKMQHIQDFYSTMRVEILDKPFAEDFIKKQLSLRVLTLDCRDYAVHFDWHATVAKYPYYEKLGGKGYFDIKQRYVDPLDIEEI